MRSLLELISKYSSENSIMPIIALAAIFGVLILYVLVKTKWVKYLTTTVIIIIGAVIMYSGYENMLEPSGLNMIITATKVLTFGLVGFMFALILDIIDSICKIFKKDKKKTKREEKIHEKQKIKYQETNNTTINDATKFMKLDKDDETKVVKLDKDDETKMIDLRDIRDIESKTKKK